MMKRADRLVLLQPLPQFERAAAGEAAFEDEGAAQPLDLGYRVGTGDPVESARRGSNKAVKF